MKSTASTRSRLFRQDRQIAINTLQATFPGWRDRFVGAIMLLAGLAVVRFWFADQPSTIAAWAALGAGVVLGSGAGSLIAARLAFHSFDGLLVADALHPPERRRYMAAWHSIGIALLTATTLIARPSVLVVSLPAYMGAALVVGLAGGISVPRTTGGSKQAGWTIRAWLHRPSAGAAAAMILLLSLLPARELGTSAPVAVAGVETTLLALCLTTIDNRIVRFMTVAGHGWWRIATRHGKSMASFAVLAVPGCWLILGPVASGVVAAISIATFLLLILRILAYRLHGKRFADLLVSILAGLLMLVTYAMPVALPVAVIIILWHLHHRGSARTWLLA